MALEDLRDDGKAGRISPAGAPRRLKIGEAIERWVDGEADAVSGRIVFQLEEVYNTKTLLSGKRRRYGPYGPYWYVYYYAPAGGPRAKGGRDRWRSRYLGRPEHIDPRTLTPSQLGKLLKG